MSTAQSHRGVILKLLESKSTPTATLLSALRKNKACLSSHGSKLPVIFLFLTNGARSEETLNVLKVLIELTSTADLCYVTETGNNILHIVSATFPQSISLFMEFKGLRDFVNKVNDNGDSCMHYACFYGCLPGVMELLEVEDVDVNVKVSPSINLAKRGCVLYANIVNAQNNDGMTPLTMLLKHQKMESEAVVIQYLKKGGVCDWMAWSGVNAEIEEFRVRELGLEDLDHMGVVMGGGGGGGKEKKEKKKKKKKKKGKGGGVVMQVVEVEDEVVEEMEEELGGVREKEVTVEEVKSTWASVLSTTLMLSVDDNVASWEMVGAKKEKKIAVKMDATKKKKKKNCRCRDLMLKLKPELRHLGLEMTDFFKTGVSLAMLSPSQLSIVSEILEEQVKAVAEAKEIQERVLQCGR
ncbi:hypothetical protein TL16_g06613 [Triparma laevis f. inornata]|uniref:Uncharacterized protein n=1 Tax=Triparma laevis f. inornata TaxID=1714386 RepID=A0A9W7AS35_9STRA|nr:hypothetical protein TL16_g06613 [Triparma laevis f. inornata]